MNAIIKKGKHLLFLMGASAMNLEDIENELILNFNTRYNYKAYSFKKNRLVIETTEGDVELVFSSLVKEVKLEVYVKDQLVFKIVKDDN
jgi:hypothetical protein